MGLPGTTPIEIETTAVVVTNPTRREVPLVINHNCWRREVVGQFPIAAFGRSVYQDAICLGWASNHNRFDFDLGVFSLQNAEFGHGLF